MPTNNPDLPVVRELDRQLLEALMPFVEAATMGVATYEAVKAARLREQGLSSYETVYISAGSHAAQSRVSFSDWHRMSKLAPMIEAALSHQEVE